MSATKSEAASPSLGRSATRGAATTLGGQLARILVQLSGIVILARLLTPTDYGLLAAVTSIIGLGEILRDFGLSSAAIQAKTLSKAQKDNLFWINSGIGLVLAATVCAVSGPIAALFHDDRLQWIAIALSLTFLFNGISTQFRADLNRKFKFFRLTLIEIVGQALGLAIGIGMALSGFTYWSLVGQQLSAVVIQLLLFVIFTGWRPGWMHRHAEMGSFIRFGLNLGASQVLNYIGRNTDSIVIGATLGATPLGLYNRAFNLMLLPLNQINAPSTRVALPVLARLQEERKRYDEFISLGQTFMLNIVSVILAFACAQAPSIILIALGSQWMASVPIFQVLTIAGFFQAAALATFWVFLSKGLTKANLHYSLSTRPIMIGLILLGSLGGVMGVAWVYAFTQLFAWVVGLIWISRVSDAPVKRLVLNGVRTAIIYAIATGVSLLSTYFIAGDLLVLKLAVGLVALVATLAVAALVCPPYRRDLLGMARTRQYFRPAKAARPVPADSPDGQQL